MKYEKPNVLTYAKEQNEDFDPGSVTCQTSVQCAVGVSGTCSVVWNCQSVSQDGNIIPGF